MLQTGQGGLTQRDQCVTKLFCDTNFFYTESDTFFNTKFVQYRIRYFFAIKLSWYQIFPIPNPLLFILIFFKTESDTFFYINFFYTESDTFLIPNIFDTESDTIKKIESF